MSSAAGRVSVDGARGNDPFARLPGDGGDAVEVRVVVKHRQAVRLGRRRNEEIRQLSAALMLGVDVADVAAVGGATQLARESTTATPLMRTRTSGRRNPATWTSALAGSPS
jgi:hypothetical protein